MKTHLGVGLIAAYGRIPVIAAEIFDVAEHVAFAVLRRGAAEAAAQAGPQSPFSPPSRYSMRSDRNAEEVSSRNLGALDEAWDAIRQRFAFECDSKVKRARTLSQLLLSRRASSSGMIAVSRENLAADKPPVPARFASAGV